ncbi:OprO/OprP family phosphate-selective porin [Qipengyuania sp.]|uniref:OprO/OprP family phosphate-selective porin n=1 Tax=Qipengyuania sp. TaxID=2004515 RepID=UPI0037355B40
MTYRAVILAAALGSTAMTAMPAAAQSVGNPAPADDLAQMRAELAALAAKVAALEEELAAERAQQGDAGAAAAAVPAAAAPDASGDESPTITFKGAPEIEAEGGWTFKPRGRLQADAGFVSAPDGTGDDGFGSELRRARLGVQGTMPGGFGYKFEVDAAGNEIELVDAIITYADDGLTITAGQHNNFQSLEELTSSLFTSFIERAAFTDAFGFQRRLGLSAQYEAGALILQGGIFSDNAGDLPSRNYSVDGRAVYMPKLGEGQLHLGGSIHLTDLEADASVRYRQRPLVHFTSTRFVDTGAIDTTRELGFGAEAAYIAGPFHVAGEAFWQRAERTGTLPDAAFFGGYAEAGLFLTKGDTRGYRKGQFDRIRPQSPVGDGGMGAVQIVARYDRLDLDDADITGGKQDGYYLSLIWTPTDYTRLMLNYGHLDYSDAVLAADNGETDYGVDSVALRAQIDF